MEKLYLLLWERVLQILGSLFCDRVCVPSVRHYIVHFIFCKNLPKIFLWNVSIIKLSYAYYYNVSASKNFIETHVVCLSDLGYICLLYTSRCV